MAKIRLSIVNDYEIVVRGLAALVDEAEDFEIVQITTDHAVAGSVDIVLYDTFGSADPDLDQLRAILEDAHVARVVVFTWSFEADHVAEATALGVRGYLSKALGSDELLDALRRVHAGEHVISERPARNATGTAARQWPGQGMDLTEKEADVLALITRGLDNQQIARLLYISPNTLKTRIRHLYRKLGVTSRVQAALWGVKHGFEPDNDIRWSDVEWSS